jgi:hypothetical protein
MLIINFGNGSPPNSSQFIDWKLHRRNDISIKIDGEVYIIFF